MCATVATGWRAGLRETRWSVEITEWILSHKHCMRDCRHYRSWQQHACAEPIAFRKTHFSIMNMWWMLCDSETRLSTQVARLPTRMEHCWQHFIKDGISMQMDVVAVQYVASAPGPSTAHPYAWDSCMRDRAWSGNAQRLHFSGHVSRKTRAGSVFSLSFKEVELYRPQETMCTVET